MRVGASSLNCSSVRIFFNYVAWQTQVVTVTNSALVVDNMTIGCFLDDHETTLVTVMKIYPDVLF